jgi:large subunit ribosomal protein L10
MRAEKQLLRDEIQGQIENFNSFVIMSYRGFSANEANKFRTNVAKMGGTVEMMRKRLLLKAAEKAGITIDPQFLDGHIGLVFAGKDPIPVTKFVCNTSKEAEDKITVLGGRFDGTLYGAEQVKMLAELPGKDEMRAQLLATLEAPLSQTVSVMNSILTSIMHCLENKSKQS